MFKTNMFAAVAAAGFAFGAIAAATTPAPAFAKEIQVHYSDLNLATPEGQKKLDRRIQTAAREVCAYDRTTTGSRLRSTESAECYAKARENVRSQVAGAVDKASGERLAISQ
jgi:UrcA family protein